mmetsp:Transcript_2993/g.8192  ORF Transcript_2993/g.8192 Transcript_2993/m.8192 type:complete len:221 (+) Transcript_2993:659-1321(+)
MPVDSMVKRKWFLTFCSLTVSRHSSSPDRALTSSFVSWNPRGSFTTARREPPSPSTAKGHLSAGKRATSWSARSPATSRASTTCGQSRYQAVATGLHLACSSPVPFTQCASRSISCPGRSLARRMSSCTGATPAASPMRFSRSSWFSLKTTDVSSCISLPAGSHSRSPESTRSPSSDPSSRRAQAARSRSTMVLSCVETSPSSRNWNSRGLARRGTSPRR